ncbi:hypothetical protein J6590_029420 [Homalodisca vitripennis]|nr:hypothetical protein J6590_029416 [Homalodisca vitripennis]KAG8244063.1 hypothetical protein J6590_029420 [Homalodisca vitripennis]
MLGIKLKENGGGGIVNHLRRSYSLSGLSGNPELNSDLMNVGGRWWYSEQLAAQLQPQWPLRRS